MLTPVSRPEYALLVSTGSITRRALAVRGRTAKRPAECERRFLLLRAQPDPPPEDAAER